MDKKTALISSFSSTAIGMPVDVVFSFDTTGSMYSCLTEVRKHIANTTTRLLGSIPRLRIAIIAHGDYCDQGTYVTRQLDFSSDVKELTDFINNVPSTGGGDSPEAYELVLQKANSLSWEPSASKALVMIGDDVPHQISFTKEKISWRNELQELSDKGVKVYGVFAGGGTNELFYQEIAELSGGVYLHLSDFAYITDMFTAICYREADPAQLAEYEKEVKERKGKTMEKGLAKLFRTLSGRNLIATKTTSRSCDAAWWNEETDRKHPCTPQFAYDSKLEKWVSVAGAGSGAFGSGAFPSFSFSSSIPVDSFGLGFAPKATAPRFGKVAASRAAPKAAAAKARPPAKPPVSKPPKAKKVPKAKPAKKAAAPRSGAKAKPAKKAAAPRSGVKKATKAKATPKTTKASATSAAKANRSAKLAQYRRTLATPYSVPETPAWMTAYTAPKGTRASPRVKGIFSDVK